MADDNRRPSTAIDMMGIRMGDSFGRGFQAQLFYRLEPEGLILSAQAFGAFGLG
jgi:hypothetical protein